MQVVMDGIFCFDSLLRQKGIYIYTVHLTMSLVCVLAICESYYIALKHDYYKNIGWLSFF